MDDVVKARVPAPRLNFVHVTLRSYNCNMHVESQFVIGKENHLHAL